MSCHDLRSISVAFSSPVYLGDPGAASRDDAIGGSLALVVTFARKYCSPENIALSRVAAWVSKDAVSPREESAFWEGARAPFPNSGCQSSLVVTTFHGKRNRHLAFCPCYGLYCHSHWVDHNNSLKGLYFPKCCDKWTGSIKVV